MYRSSLYLSLYRLIINNLSSVVYGHDRCTGWSVQEMTIMEKPQNEECWTLSPNPTNTHSAELELWSEGVGDIDDFFQLPCMHPRSTHNNMDFKLCFWPSPLCPFLSVSPNRVCPLSSVLILHIKALLQTYTVGQTENGKTSSYISACLYRIFSVPCSFSRLHCWHDSCSCSWHCDSASWVW